MPNIEKMEKEKDVAGLMKALTDRNIEIRIKAAKKSGMIKDRGAVDALIGLLESKDHTEREQSIIALGKIGDKKAVKPLIKILKNDHWTNQVTAGEALTKIGRLAVESLIEVLDIEYPHGGDDMKQFAKEFAAKRLLAGDWDEYWMAKEQAALALGRIGDGRAVESLMPVLVVSQLLNQKSLGNLGLRPHMVVVRVINALGNLGGSEIKEIIANFLKVEDQDVQKAAKEALIRISARGTK